MAAGAEVLFWLFFRLFEKPGPKPGKEDGTGAKES